MLHLPDIDPTPPEIPWVALDPPVTASELATILSGRYRGSASSGLSSLPSQCIRYLPAGILRSLATFFQRLSRLGTVPESWQTTAIVPVWKRKGEPTDATTYRGISVVHPLAKLYALVLLGRLDKAA